MKNLIANWLVRRPRIDASLCALNKNRLSLPVISLRHYFPEFEQHPVEFFEVPVGPWSSPIEDVLMLSKIVKCTSPGLVLEVGSYKGFTALSMARCMAENTRLVTVDRHPDHGEAYQNTAFADQIDRKVGEISRELLADYHEGSFDLIFLDAGHRYEEVKSDTETLLPLLAPKGYFIWHDYDNWGKFNRLNGVPEYLHDLAEDHTIAQIAGSNLGMHCPLWDTPDGRAQTSNCFIARGNYMQQSDPWISDRER